MKRKLFSKIRIATSLHLIIAMLAFLVGGQIVNAAALTSITDTMSRLKASPTTSTHAIKFTTPTGATDSTDTIIVTFPSDFNFTSKSTTTITFTHGSTTGAEVSETLAGSPTATAWGVAFSGTQQRILTLTAPTDGIGAAALLATQKIIISYDSTNAINASAGSYAIGITGTFGDTGTTTVPIIADDQLALTAQVDGSITFTVSANTANFGTLGAGAARFASSTAAGDTVEATSTILTVGTNATNGFTMTINSGSANQGTLTSGANTIATSSTNVASSPGTEQFGVRLSVFGGSNVTVAAPYAAAGFAFDSANFPQTVGSGTTATANATFGVRYIANIASNTEAGAYTATHTYVATANF